MIINGKIGNDWVYDLMTNYQNSAEFLQFIKDNQNLYDYILEYVNKAKDEMLPKTELTNKEIADAMYEYLIQETYCLNCFNSIELSKNIFTCEKCAWRNEFDTDPVINPIKLKKLIFKDYTVQIAYPLLDKSLLQYLPEKLRDAVLIFLKTPEKLTKKQYDNIFNNIYSKDLSKLSNQKKKFDARIEFIKFFKTTNFLK